MSEQSLEQKVNDKQSKSFARKALNLGFSLITAAGTTALGLATAGSVAPIVGAAFAGGGVIGGIVNRKKSGKSLYDILRGGLNTYSAVNTVLYPMVALGNATYPIVGKLGADLFGTIGPYITRTAYALTAYNMAFTTAFRAAHHLYENNFDPTGIGKSITTNFWKGNNKIAMLMTPAYALTANGIHDFNIFGTKVPAFAANAVPASYINAVTEHLPEKKGHETKSAASHSAQPIAQPAHMYSSNMPGMYGSPQLAAA